MGGWAAWAGTHGKGTWRRVPPSLEGDHHVNEVELSGMWKPWASVHAVTGVDTPRRISTPTAPAAHPLLSVDTRNFKLEAWHWNLTCELDRKCEIWNLEFQRQTLNFKISLTISNHNPKLITLSSYTQIFFSCYTLFSVPTPSFWVSTPCFWVPAPCFSSEILRDFQRFSDNFRNWNFYVFYSLLPLCPPFLPLLVFQIRDFQRFSEIYIVFQIFSDIFKDF